MALFVTVLVSVPRLVLLDHQNIVVAHYSHNLFASLAPRVPDVNTLLQTP